MIHWAEYKEMNFLPIANILLSLLRHTSKEHIICNPMTSFTLSITECTIYLPIHMYLSTFLSIHHKFYMTSVKYHLNVSYPRLWHPFPSRKYPPR